MTKQVSHFDELYPSRFIKSGEVTNSPIYTIKNVYLDELENDKGNAEPKGVIAFNEISQELTLNKTNGECIKAMFGAAVADWIGKRIQLIKGEDRFGSKNVDAVRIGGSPDIDADIAVHVTYKRRKAKDFTLRALGAKPKAKTKTKFDITDQAKMDKFMSYARQNGWELAEKALATYDITDADKAHLKNLLEVA